MIGPGRGIERREPDPVDAELAHVLEARADSRKVADAVAVGIHEAADIDLVQDGVPPPLGHAATTVRMSSGAGGSATSPVAFCVHAA